MYVFLCMDAKIRMANENMYLNLSSLICIFCWYHIYNVSESHSNNNSCFYSRMAFLIRWAKRRNPHLIVCIEHPKGQIAELPVVMKELAQEIGPLYQPAVNYRAFGRSDSTKPTIIWTNVSTYIYFVEQVSYLCTNEMVE